MSNDGLSPPLKLEDVIVNPRTVAEEQRSKATKLMPLRKRMQNGAD